MPKAPPIIPVSINEVYIMVDAKIPEDDIFDVLEAIEAPSNKTPQKMPPMMTKIEPTSEVMAIPS
jgi:hypothetical protein